jgi:hypothetical protein
MTARCSLAERMVERVSSSWVGDIERQMRPENRHSHCCTPAYKMTLTLHVGAPDRRLPMAVGPIPALERPSGWLPRRVFTQEPGATWHAPPPCLCRPPFR